MINAVFSLYSGKYENGIAYSDRILQRKQCKEALFVKARCLAMLGQYAEADALHVILANIMGKDIDAKDYFAVATVNEQIGDPGLGIMQSIIKIHPHYVPAILKFRVMMQTKDLRLEAQEPNVLVDAFNGNIEERARKIRKI